MMQHAFEQMAAERVEFKTDMLNIQARHGLRNIGAREEGTLRSFNPMPDGRRRDAVYYSVLGPSGPEVSDQLLTQPKVDWRRDSGGFRGVVPPGQHRGGFRGSSPRASSGTLDAARRRTFVRVSGDPFEVGYQHGRRGRPRCVSSSTTAWPGSTSSPRGRHWLTQPGAGRVLGGDRGGHAPLSEEIEGLAQGAGSRCRRGGAAAGQARDHRVPEDPGARRLHDLRQPDRGPGRRAGAGPDRGPQRQPGRPDRRAGHRAAGPAHRAARWC